MMRVVIAVLMLAGPVWGARIPEEARFDMGSDQSPVAEDFIRITPKMKYHVDIGYGFTERLPQKPFDDAGKATEALYDTYPRDVGPFSEEVLRDGVESDGPIHFRANRYPGYYYVTVAVGRYAEGRHDLTISINGEPVADNVDAWGPVSESAGGPATRTVKALAHTKKGRIIVTVNCKKAADDRWKEYTDKAPEGGKLAFLGPNRATILAVTMRPVRPSPIKTTGGKLSSGLKDENVVSAIAAFNRGEIDKAIEATLKIDKPGRDLPRGLLLEGCIGRLELMDRAREMELLNTNIKTLESALRYAPLSPTIRERLEQHRRYRRARQLLNPLPEDKASALPEPARYWRAYDLCAAFVPDDPLYLKANLVCGQVANWAAKRGDWKHCKELAQKHFEIVKKANPGKPIPEELK